MQEDNEQISEQEQLQDVTSENLQKQRKIASDAVPVTLRNEFYNDSKGRLFSALGMSLMTTALLVFILYYIMANPPPPKYFATTTSGRITPLTPLDKPNQIEAGIIQWANRVAIAVHSYSFVTYRSELQAASQYFTIKGWAEFQSQLVRSNILDMVVSKKFIVTAQATRSPDILKKGVAGGYYYWQIRVPLMVTYQSPNESSQESKNIVLLVRRISSLNSPHGVGIDQYSETRN